MPSQDEDRRLNTRRLRRLVFVVGLSILLPLAIAGWWVTEFLSGKTWGRRTNEFKNFLSSCARNGELWFLTTDISTYEADKPGDFRLRRLDLMSGIERETNITIRAIYCIPIWIKDRLFLITDRGFYETDGDLPVSTAKPLPARPTSIYQSHPLFSYDGQLTTIIEPNPHEFRLTHFVDDKWIDGRKIRLPGRDRSWYHDAERGRPSLVPITSAQPPLSAVRIRQAANPELQVLQHDGQTHLSASIYPDFSAYRNGFEFVDEDETVPSALVPENDLYEVSGWEPIHSVPDEQHIFSQMKCDQHGPVFLAWGVICRCVRRQPDGTWQPIDLLPEDWGTLVADPDESISYVVHSRPWYDTWNSGKVGRIDKETVHPIHVRWPGETDKYLSRWRRLKVGLILAWLVHLAIIIGGTARISENSSDSRWMFGDQQASLASLGRRLTALAIDLFLGFATLSILLWTFVDWAPMDIDRQCNTLFELERNPQRLLLNSFLVFLPTPKNKQAFTFIILITAVLFLIPRTAREGRFGTTVGKRLTGIRTIRTTLRPCGIPRSLVRTVLYWIDLFGLITPLPAAISMMLSTHRQRLGDRVADTIVVLANSIHPCDRDPQPDPKTEILQDSAK